MQKNIPQLILAAPSSGSGKTTVARGLMKLLRNKGFTVQPYKCGPDYIDTKFHTAVCGRPSVNLDSFMATPEHIQWLYRHYAEGADACIVEGMMGLYDGYDRDRGSVAEIAKMLHLPVVLVVDARSAAYSIAPLLHGFLTFKPGLDIRGVIFNKVGSERHYGMLLQVCTDLNLECFGYLPKSRGVENSSRYLGLDFSQQADIDSLAALMEQHIDWQRLVSKATMPIAAATEASQPRNLLFNHIMVARNDESFSFLYQEHIDILKQLGPTSFFNPEEGQPLPTDTDLLYLPGGYPEKHLDALEAASTTRLSICEYAQRGGKVLAECGGMMYLCRSILRDMDNGTAEVPMCGVLPYTISARQADRRLSLGYRQFSLNGQQLRGHEFHYTQFADGQIPPSVTQVYNATGGKVSTPVFVQGNTVASYTHLYWGECRIDKLFKP